MIDLVTRIPLAGLMLVVALGFLLGRMTWRGLALGPAGGTLLVALGFGSLGLHLDALYGTDTPRLSIGDFGFALFIYSVGFEAGPRFFASLKGGVGWRFVVLGLLVNAFAMGASIAWGTIFRLGDAVTAGVLAGALTSTPTFAAAEAVCSDPNALSVVFAFAYPVGLTGLVLIVQWLPRRLGQDLGPTGESDAPDHAAGPRGGELTRVFEVRNPGAIGVPLRELGLSRKTGCWITTLHRGMAFEPARAETVLEEGDHLMVRGRLDELMRFGEAVGPEVYDDELRRRLPSPRRVVVTAADAVGETLEGLALPRRFGLAVLGVERGEVVLEPRADLAVEQGDVLRLVGPRGGIREAGRQLGRLERLATETDIAVYAGGILLGLLVGQLRLDLGRFNLTLGTAGGLLLAGILLGRFRRIGPFSTNVPAPARQLVRDLGILLFTAEAGVRAGAAPFAPMRGVLLPALAGAAVVTLIAVVMTVLTARVFFKRLAPVHVWGSIGGGMTSSAALTTIRRAADDSNEPALSYAAAYAVASVFVTLAGQLIVRFMTG